MLSVLSARRGVRYSAFERRVVLAHCFAGWAYAWASPALPAGEAEEKGVLSAVRSPSEPRAAHARLLRHQHARARRCPIPEMAARSAPAAARAAHWAARFDLGVVGVFERRPAARVRDPSAAFGAVLVFRLDLAHNRAKAEEAAPYFGAKTGQRLLFISASSVALGFVLFHFAPDLCDAARLAEHRHARVPLGDLGPTPYFAGFFAFVNIHHYFMDSVLWRRDNPDTRYLQR